MNQAMGQQKTGGDLILVHWDAGEAKELASSLQAMGWKVREGELVLKELKTRLPLAVLISLRRLPSHGREVADALWYTKWGRTIPIIFFDGTPDKVAATRQKFPDAEFTTWVELPTILLRHRQKEEAV